MDSKNLYKCNIRIITKSGAQSCCMITYLPTDINPNF